MVQRINIGQVILELPESGGNSVQLSRTPQRIKAEKPEDPEPLEEPQYIYRPNDPYRAYIDEAHAIASINASHKPWVKKAWFVLFIVGTLVFGELYALSQALSDQEAPWSAFVFASLPTLIFWVPCVLIWRKHVKQSVPDSAD